MRNLIFAGAGHAHLYSLARIRECKRAGADVTVISPGKFWYSGMGPGMLSGRYEPHDDTVDVRHLTESGGGRFIEDHVAKIDMVKRELHIASGRHVAYDLLALNLGSEVPLEKIPGAADAAIPVKPIKNLFDLRENLRRSSECSPIVIIGGGAAACEIAANLWHLQRGLTRSTSITLVTSSARLWEEADAEADVILQSYFAKLGVAVIPNSKAVRVRESAVELENGKSIPFRTLVVATGIRAPALLCESGLSCAEDGAMCVNEFLQSIDHPEIFGAGDCVSFGASGLPRVGVYAVRQGPVLHENLIASLQSAPLKKFRPQKKYLLILNLGDGTGLFARGRFVFRNRLAFAFKNWLDRRFVGKFQPR